MAVAINEMLLQPSPLGEVFAGGYTLPGPASYNNTGVFATSGALLTARAFGLLSSIKFIFPEIATISGTFFIRALRSGTGVGVATVRVHWYVFATGVEVANTFNLSAESIRILAIGN